MNVMYELHRALVDAFKRTPHARPPHHSRPLHARLHRRVAAASTISGRKIGERTLRHPVYRFGPDHSQGV